MVGNKRLEPRPWSVLAKAADSKTWSDAGYDELPDWKTIKPIFKPIFMTD